MKILVVGGILLSLLPCVGLAQQALAVPQADRIQVDQVLQRYLSAYQHKSLEELVAVWPDLEKQKKEFGKIKHHFADGSITDEQMTVTPLDVQATSNGVVVRVERQEKFVKTETTTSLTAGELLGTVMTPTTSVKTENIQKADKVWIMMRRTNDNWIILSISDKNPLPAARPVA
jgi:hypothetical protein